MRQIQMKMRQIQTFQINPLYNMSRDDFTAFVLCELLILSFWFNGIFDKGTQINDPYVKLYFENF